MGANSDGRFQTRQVYPFGTVTSDASAATEQTRVKFFTQTLVREVRGIVNVAGTATTAGFTILKNTTSIGALVLGVSTANAAVDAALADTTFAATDVLVLKNITSDTALSAKILVDYSELFSAT
jgi:hypothetical protein